MCCYFILVTRATTLFAETRTLGYSLFEEFSENVKNLFNCRTIINYVVLCTMLFEKLSDKTNFFGILTYVGRH